MQKIREITFHKKIAKKAPTESSKWESAIEKKSEFSWLEIGKKISQLLFNFVLEINHIEIFWNVFVYHPIKIQNKILEMLARLHLSCHWYLKNFLVTFHQELKKLHVLAI